ncbi:MAG: NnrS family protein, partial [Deltaproteobacteria bacterium]
MAEHRLQLSGEAPLADQAGPGGAPILRKGFRPFFALAGAYAIVIVPLWIVIRSGILPGSGWVTPTQWHAHEMIFGFTAAVIAGFLLTAASNWTKRVTAVGPGLLLLVGLWVLGRVATTVPGVPAALVAAVDVSFFPAVGIAIGRPIVAAGSRRNYVFLVLIALFTAASAAVHLEALGLVPGGARRGHLVSVDLVLMVVLVITGRIIPAFTRGATGADDITNSQFLDRATLFGMGVLVVLDAAVPDFPPRAWLAGVVGILALLRMRGWGTRHSLKKPLLLVLHVGYLWIPVGLILRAGASLPLGIPSSAALHALTAGAIGTLTLGMMARVSLGHTGRVLRADRGITTAFILVTLAATVRVVGTFLGYTPYRRALELSATLWSV